jgi:hypothetical protein
MEALERSLLKATRKIGIPSPRKEVMVKEDASVYLPAVME